MTYQQLPPTIQQIAQTELTPKQLITYRLHANGMSERRIAIHLRISRRAVRDRLTQADIKIARHLEETT